MRQIPHQYWSNEEEVLHSQKQYCEGTHTFLEVHQIPSSQLWSDLVDHTRNSHKLIHIMIIH